MRVIFLGLERECVLACDVFGTPRLIGHAKHYYSLYKSEYRHYALAGEQARDEIYYSGSVFTHIEVMDAKSAKENG